MRHETLEEAANRCVSMEEKRYHETQVSWTAQQFFEAGAAWAKSQAEAEINRLTFEKDLSAEAHATKLAAEKARSTKLVEVIQQAAHEVETAKRGFANIGMQNICLNEADLILHQALVVHEGSEP